MLICSHVSYNVKSTCSYAFLIALIIYIYIYEKKKNSFSHAQGTHAILETGLKEFLPSNM
jgi:hypothetical protein